MRYLLLIVIALLLLGGCKKDQTLAAVAQIVGPILLEQTQIALNDPDLSAQLGQPGADIAALLAEWLLPRIQNEISNLATSPNEQDRRNYKYIRKAKPDVALMLDGLTPRLEAQLDAKGYMPSTAKKLGKFGPVKFTADDYNSMLKVLEPAIIEEYKAVETAKGVE